MTIRTHAFAFEAPHGHPGTIHHAPEPDRGGNDPLPDREWGLSAGQVVAVVVAIIAACQVFGALF